MKKRSGFALEVWPCGEDKPLYMTSEGDSICPAVFSFDPAEAFLFDNEDEAIDWGEQFREDCPNGCGYDPDDDEQDTCTFMVIEVSE